MKNIKLPLLLASLLAASSLYAASCENHLHIENTTTDQFIKMREGMFSETEFIIKPGETYKKCFVWGISSLSIKSIDIANMTLVKVPTCPQHLTVNGSADIVIKSEEGKDKYSCQLNIVKSEKKHGHAHA